VNIKGKGGLVEKVGLRMIILRDLDGSVHLEVSSSGLVVGIC
jgi:hypothetical protein